MKTLFGLDLGNGDIKVASNMTNEPKVFPSVVGILDDYSSLDLGSKDKVGNMSIKHNEKEYAIGSMAIRNSTIRSHDVTEDKYLSESTGILAHTAFSLTSDFAFSSAGVVIGLPIHKMNIAKSVATEYKGKQFGARLGFFGAYEDKVKKVEISKVAIVAQPHGTLFNLILDSRGELENEEMANKGVAIFDIGYKTNDGIVFRNLDPVGRLTIHSKSGMHVAYEQIRNKIGRMFNGLEMKSYEIPEVIKTGEIKGHDVREIANDVFFNLAINIASEIKSKWEDAWEVEQMVFTGGGASLLQPYLSQVFPSAIFCGQTSNVEGFLKYACRLWGGKE